MNPDIQFSRDRYDTDKDDLGYLEHIYTPFFKDWVFTDKPFTIHHA